MRLDAQRDVRVTFVASGKEARWTPNDGSVARSRFTRGGTNNVYRSYRYVVYAPVNGLLRTHAARRRHAASREEAGIPNQLAHSRSTAVRAARQALPDPNRFVQAHPSTEAAWPLRGDSTYRVPHGGNEQRVTGSGRGCIGSTREPGPAGLVEACRLSGRRATCARRTSAFRRVRGRLCNAREWHGPFRLRSPR
ncbi:hypothetical protein HDG35_004002 [Paraburkholderia sp. JPY681]|nr:hypothetical protein [Paraburkholderia atlantica]